jgi:hypothetical protein
MPELIPKPDELRDLHAPVEWGYGHLTGHPYVMCACGWESSATPRWWQDVGEELDEHIARARRLA